MSAELPFKLKQNWRALAKVFDNKDRDISKVLLDDLKDDQPMATDNKDVLLDLDRAASISGLSVTTIRLRCAQGEIKAHQDDNGKRRWHISRNSLIDYCDKIDAEKREKIRNSGDINGNASRLQKTCKLCDKSKALRWFSKTTPDVCLHCEKIVDDIPQADTPKGTKPGPVKTYSMEDRPIKRSEPIKSPITERFVPFTPPTRQDWEETQETEEEMNYGKRQNILQAVGDPIESTIRLKPGEVVKELDYSDQVLKSIVLPKAADSDCKKQNIKLQGTVKRLMELVAFLLE